ncbi:protein masquerade-like isoform X2 [Portunus trituberculatus]|uniref:protein masquerade-like isoform X2 n=1 Tax=Portunus trituberculatus TaxID=210409 RepID=UPI001E1CE267|nr:protein masquerade-like isoform X2 [Portunus trituberculatus]
MENIEDQHESHQNEDQTDYGDELILQPVNQNICGFKGPSMPEPSGSSHILGGMTASTLEWCWITALMERHPGGNKYICSGALIEPDLVLTTATCLRRLGHNDLSNYIVVLGDSDLKDDLPYGIQFHSIIQAVVHPHYYASGGAHVNDIGLLKLRNQATLTDNVCLMCIPHQDVSVPASQCVVVGYGVRAFPDSTHNSAYHQTQTVMHNYGEVVGGKPSEGVLRKLSVPLLGAEECRNLLHNVTGSKILAESDSFLCGGIGNGAACYSTVDGGSPLGCEVGGRWFLTGLVSWSRDCSSSGPAGIYSRTSAFTG